MKENKIIKITAPLVEYLAEILNELQASFDKINVNFLANEEGNYSLDRIPTETPVEKWIISARRSQTTYEFRSRMGYGEEQAINLVNIGFWEAFEQKINSNNRNGILPNIPGIEEISCLNCGSIQDSESRTCEMSIQVQIIYKEVF